jgi:hypothetical protein
VLVAEPLGFGETNAVNDRGVVQFIRYDSIVWSQQTLEYARVGIETAGIQNSILLMGGTVVYLVA